MRIIVFYKSIGLVQRNTITDHEFSFRRYDMENEYFYFDIYNGRYAEDYAWIKNGMFDAVIFHYTAMSLRDGKYWSEFYELMCSIFADKACIKIIMPQDDYTYTERIWKFAKGLNADGIYTPIREMDHAIIYPQREIGNIRIKTVLTGYVEESYLASVNVMPHKDREYDVVYRARKLPYSFGKHGQLKYEIADLFREYLEISGMKYDINNTGDDHNAILGDHWLEFLASSRLTIGCLGSAGFMDQDNSIYSAVCDYTEKHPEATYEETQAAVFPEVTDNLHGVLSPRVFEAAITKTCQVLVGDDYHGIIMPDEDYIMLKNDFSNIDEVIEKMKDVAYCEGIAEKCYDTLINSGKYTYRMFAQEIAGDIRSMLRAESDTRYSSEYIESKCEENNDKVRIEMQESWKRSMLLNK